MPKLLSEADFNVILDAISKQADGVDVAGISSAIGHPIPRRTLQRRLAMLVSQQRIRSWREHRAVRYGLAATSGTAFFGGFADRVAAPSGFYMPMSPESAQITEWVRQPVQARRPVGYNMAFLEAYRPNDTSYLPPALQDQLHTMGRSPAEQAPAGTFARDILNRLLIDLSWASSRLEGNTYDRLDTERLIHFGEAAEGKDAVETQMILNHKAAIEFLVHGAGHVAVDEGSVVALHAFLSDSLLGNPAACGRLRNRPVQISGSVYLPISLPQRIEELFGIVLQMGAEIRDPFEQAFFLMVHLPYLQPFEDVNKRVSRLAANIPLIKANLSPLSFIDVPERVYVDALLGVYELNRIELLRDVFVWAYERSCQQYLAVQSQLVPPDVFRLRYRVALAETVRGIVRAGAPVTPDSVRRHMSTSVPIAEQEKFIALVVREFESLHSGNAIRFGIRPLEFEGWMTSRSGA